MEIYSSELPAKCKSFVEELKSKGFIIRGVRFDKIFNTCIIDFFDKQTYSKLQSFEGVVPYAWYESSIEYTPDKEEISFNLNKYVSSKVVEIYIPKECGNGSCRVHIGFEEPKKIGFQGSLFKYDKFKEFFNQFFYI